MSHERETDERRIADRLRAAYHDTPLPDAGERERLVAALGTARPRQRWISPRAWFEPRAFSLRPASLVAAGLALLAAGLLAGRVLDRPGLAPSPGASEETVARAVEPGLLRPVTFVLADAGASRVAVVGDFNGWDPAATVMRRDPSNGLWTVTITLPSGWHPYSFVVDGARWLPDPRAPMAPAGDFGAGRSVVVVGEGEA